jgi:C4-dicarboxylate-specific signal transduction histidine kinase
LKHAKSPFSVEFKPHGLGVGITIAKTLVEKLGGKFSLEQVSSGNGRPSGTVCQITLQISTPPEQPPRDA